MLNFIGFNCHIYLKKYDTAVNQFKSINEALPKTFLTFHTDQIIDLWQGLRYKFMCVCNMTYSGIKTDT